MRSGRRPVSRFGSRAEEADLSMPVLLRCANPAVAPLHLEPEEVENPPRERQTALLSAREVHLLRRRHQPDSLREAPRCEPSRLPAAEGRSEPCAVIRSHSAWVDHLLPAWELRAAVDIRTPMALLNPRDRVALNERRPGPLPSPDRCDRRVVRRRSRKPCC